MLSEKNKLILLGLILGILAIVGFFMFMPKAGATELQIIPSPSPEVSPTPTECVELTAPDPITFEKNVAKVGTINATYKWFDNGDGTWTLKIDIDPQGGENHRDWRSEYPSGWGTTGLYKLLKKPVDLPQTFSPNSCWDGKQGETPTFAGSSTEAPRCGDGSTSQVVANAHVIRNGTHATVNFFITEGDSANLYWKVVTSSDWQNAVADLKPNADKFVTYTVNDLNADLGYSFGIQQKSGCGGGQITSVIVDPPANGKIFRVSYFE